MQGIKQGIFNAEDLQQREERASTALRNFDKDQETLEATLEAVMDYQQFLTLGGDSVKHEKSLKKTRLQVERTLAAAPWKQCRCDICSAPGVGVEVIIFRSANRNRRRGFHNLGVYHQHVQRILEKNQ
jgi:hypothetical protein